MKKQSLQELRGGSKLTWARNPTLDYFEAETELGTYLCVRTWADVSKLSFNGELLNSDATTGSHAANRLLAQKHYDALIERAE